MAKDRKDELADALARMARGESESVDPSPAPAAGQVSRPLPNVALPTASPSPGARPMATPQPRAKASPTPTISPNPAQSEPRPTRTLPSLPAASKSHASVKSDPTAKLRGVHRALGSQTVRATVTPSLLVLGTLLFLSAGASVVAGDALVIGSLPGWVIATAGVCGGLLLAAGIANVRVLRGAEVSGAEV